MLDLRFIQSMLWTPTIPTIRPSGSTIAVCRPSLSAICRRVARMKGSTSAGSCSCSTQGIQRLEVLAVGVDQGEELVGVGLLGQAQRVAVGQLAAQHQTFASNASSAA